MQKHKLTAMAIKKAPPGKLQDGGGLILAKTDLSGKWIYRYSHLGRRREMGLGPWPAMSLAEARAARDAWQKVLIAGEDPLIRREADRAAEIADRDRMDPTFAELAALVFDSRKAGLRGEGTRGRWMSPLDIHIIPKIGKKRASQLTRHDFADALKPIWRTKHPTAEKAYQRIHIVIADGMGMGYNCNPFEVNAAKYILGQHRHKTTNIPSTPWQDLPDLYARIGTSIADDCLRFMILTLVRAHGCTQAQKDEFSDGIWTVPADRVKGMEASVEDFRVPLSRAAMNIVSAASERQERYLFSARNARPITVAAVERRMDAMLELGRPHGMRATFKTWVMDTKPCSWEVSETVLGHKTGTKVSRAYERSDLLDLRREVMDRWADYVTGASSNVVQMPRLTRTNP